MYLLDTNITSYMMRNSYPHLTEKILSIPPTQFCISSVTIYEFEYGARKRKWGEKTYQKMLMFLAPFTILPFDAEDAVTAGKVKSQLENKGTPIGPYDIMIAGQGLARNLTVITHNIDEFKRVDNLKVEDWVTENERFPH